jgi:hypothetical protein
LTASLKAFRLSATVRKPGGGSAAARHVRLPETLRPAKADKRSRQSGLRFNA